MALRKQKSFVENNNSPAAKLRKLQSANTENEVSLKFLEIEQKLCEDLKPLTFSAPVTHVYNPLLYAKETHTDYVQKYCTGRKKVLFVGMNPGPFGMAQNGVRKLIKFFYKYNSIS